MKRAGRYVLGDLLGRGGMAEVFAGHVMGDHGFQKPVAIKRLLPELANDKVFVERLIQEAKLLVGLQHGNIVSVLDLARDGEDVFLVMDFVDGPSLRQLLKARGTRGLPLGVASYIVQAAAAGLEFAHGRAGGAIIHADISPSNLLLTTSGEVRVADFGIARREGGGQGIVEGKWAYMAPEQARGEGLSPRSDVFALGVVLYELITGAHPFGRQVTADERESEQMRVIPPRVVRPTVPHGLDQICMRALAHDPRDRYARMSQMIDAIVEERFANQWRDGASDLAQAIREVVPATSANGNVGPRTMVTDRPVTIVTRSLIEATPHRRSAPRLVERTPAPVVMDSGAQTLGIESSSVSAAVAEIDDSTATPPMFDVPAALRLDGPAMPAFRLPDARMPAADLASVHGGTAHSVHVASAPGGESTRSNKWPILVMSSAAILGVVAAVVLQLRPTEVGAAPSPAPIQVAQQEPPRKTIDLATGTPSAPTAAVVEPPVAPAPITPTVPTVPETTTPEPTVAPPQEDTTETPKPVRTQPRPVAPAKKKEPGILRINAYPWAWIQIDGGSRTEERFLKVKLSQGTHKVKLYNDSGATKVRTIVIEPNRIKTITVNFEEDTLEETN
ncbi:MAG: protein kinase [Myxococcales bacterium]|nr:protein kinase [Myxococcales bacterium]